MKPAILIHGPTASGKSALSVALAKRVDGEVINADSMQVYRDLRVISARPAASEMDGVEHHLFGHVAASERYSTGKWLEAVKPIIAKVQRRGKVPIIIGGTGLYHLALTEGLSEIPPVPEDVRAEVSETYKSGGVAALREKLEQVDRATAERLGEGDRQRLSRALEVWLATGKSISSFQGKKGRSILSEGEWLGVALTPGRARLYSRIDRRFEGMLMEGAMEEARGLARAKPARRFTRYEGAWHPMAIGLFARRDESGSGRRECEARYTALRQAAIHLDRAAIPILAKNSKSFH